MIKANSKSNSKANSNTSGEQKKVRMFVEKVKRIQIHFLFSFICFTYKNT